MVLTLPLVYLIIRAFENAVAPNCGCTLNLNQPVFSFSISQYSRTKVGFCGASRRISQVHRPEQPLGSN